MEKEESFTQEMCVREEEQKPKKSSRRSNYSLSFGKTTKNRSSLESSPKQMESKVSTEWLRSQRVISEYSEKKKCKPCVCREEISTLFG